MKTIFSHNNKKNVITKTLWTDKKRLQFLPKYVGNQVTYYETSIYNFLRNHSEDYDGGFWNYYSLSNGGFYMALDQDKSLRLEQPNNYYQGSMSAEAASIAVNLYIQNHFAWTIDESWFTACFQNLRDFALQHKEASEILRFID